MLIRRAPLLSHWYGNWAELPTDKKNRNFTLHWEAAQRCKSLILLCRSKQLSQNNFGGTLLQDLQLEIAGLYRQTAHGHKTLWTSEFFTLGKSGTMLPRAPA